jgi:hypothetical protein
LCLARGNGGPGVTLKQIRFKVRIPTKPAGYSDLKAATHSDLKAATIPI